MSSKMFLSRTNNPLWSFPESYTIRDARLHLRHVRDLLRSLDPADAYNGVNCSSLSYLSYYTQRATGTEFLPVFFSLRHSQLPLHPRCFLQTLTVWGAEKLLTRSQWI